MDDPTAQNNGKPPNRSKRSRRSFSEEFKQEAVQMLLDGHTATSVAQRLGLSGPNVLDRWKKDALRQAGPAARTLGDRVVQLEDELRRVERERGWLSTEILKSAFGLYETLEGQHSKDGLTSLAASFGALLRSCHPAEVGASLRRTSVARTRQWVTMTLGKTLASKTLSAYQKTLSRAGELKTLRKHIFISTHRERGSD